MELFTHVFEILAIASTIILILAFLTELAAVSTQDRILQEIAEIVIVLFLVILVVSCVVLLIVNITS